MAWRDLAEQLDQAVVRTFDYGDVSFQKMNGAELVGDPVPLPAEYEAAFVSLDVQDGNQVSTLGPALTVHYADFLPGVSPAIGDRFVLASGRAAGTYEVDDEQPNDDRTGAVIKLKKL
jgi:hypothetical protein